MKFERRYTTADRPVEQQIQWKTVTVTGLGKAVAVPEVEVPVGWSDNAAAILADKYLRKAGVPNELDLRYISEDGVPSWLLRRAADGLATHPTGPETSAKQVFHRLAGCWTYWAWREGYFGEPDKKNQFEKYARVFYDEVYMMLALQVAVPNSPQWFNTGLHWAYGIEGPDSGMWYCDENGAPQHIHNSYERPQPHACFLTPTSDDLVNEGGIMDTWVREARIFKHGSGSGTNVSSWRARGEKLSGGGVASGVMSWLKIGDAAAGAISSGGTTRRAAVMRIMNVDHPEIEKFVDWKVREEHKAASMNVGSQVLRDAYLGNASYDDPMIAYPPQVRERAEAGLEPDVLGVGFEEEAINTVGGQNSNNSVRVTDAFMRAVEADEPWHLTARTTGEVLKTVPARDLWERMCRAAWASADPGLLFHDTINSWHTTAADGPINTCNPCAEFHSNDGNACNLASLRLTAFLREDGTIDLDAYEHATRLFTVVLDISNSMASFPAKEFAIGAYNYRTIGLGYMDLGGLLMRMALPYDSDEGRALAAGLTALMTGVAYRTSAEMAEDLGPFPRWEANRESMLPVIDKHRSASITSPMPAQIGARAQEVWGQVAFYGAQHGFRNAQTTLIAPTGTIHLVTDCDTSGIEPDYALIKHKKLAGGGSMRIVNRAVEPALRRLGYADGAVSEMLTYIDEYGTLNGYDTVDSRTHDVFACVAELEPMAHVKMLAAIQPFLSGAASKTINLPNDATVEDVSNVYRECWRLDVKAVALYRDGSKLAQPLEAAKPSIKLSDLKPTPEQVAYLSDIQARHVIDEEALERTRLGPTTETAPSLVKGIAEAWRRDPPPPVTGLERGQREQLPTKRRGYRQKARIGGQTFYLSTGEYEDGRLGEIFLGLSGAGTTLDGFANSLAKVISIALQYGVPASEIVDSLAGIRFDPSGFVELHDDVKQATSIPDFIARDLAISYLGRDDLSQRVRVVAVETGEAVVALDRRAVAIAKGGKMTGQTCTKCGGQLIQTGTCMECVDCWESTGGCG